MTDRTETKINFSTETLPTPMLLSATVTTTFVPGTMIFKPIEARFTEETEPNFQRNPYCKFKLGWHTGKSSVFMKAGLQIYWSDSIVLQRKHNEQFAELKIKNKDKIAFNKTIGQVRIPLDEVIAQGKVTQWYNFFDKEKIVGEILLDIEYHPASSFVQ